MSFWTWALEAYGRPGAREACLELQDEYRQSIPLLLWAAWAASEGRRLSFGDLMDGSSLAARWEGVAVAPLRTARRGLKPQAQGIPDDAREALRAEVKALELKAEQILMTTLEAMAPPRGPRPVPIEAALAEAAQAWASTPPQVALKRLADTLS